MGSAGEGADRCTGFAPGTAGAEVCVPVLRSRIELLEPDPLVARIDSDIEVIMKTTAEMVVAFDSSVAEPRGPNAV